MNIAGNQENIIINRAGFTTTNPYKLPNSDYWGVSIKDGKKTLYKITFLDRKGADLFASRKSDEITIIKLPIVNESGKSIKTMFFFTKKDADSYTKLLSKKDMSHVVDQAKLVAERQTMILEDSLDDLPSVDEELEAELIEFNDDYEQDVDNAETKAKHLLYSIAKYYLGEDILNNNEYVKYRLIIEEASLSGLVFQLSVSKKAIYSILKQIHIGKGGSKLFDSLASLQRVILDINKYQSMLIKELTDDFKRVRDRNAEIERANAPVDGSDGIISYTSDRSKLIEEIKEAINIEGK